MRLRQTILIIFAVLAVATFVYARVSSSSPAQKKRETQQRRKPSGRNAGSAKAGRTNKPDYSKFSHRTRQHLGACNSCHEIPTTGSVKLRGYPDVADYPDHNACVRCHRQEFFNGARPQICTVCHTQVSPRDGARFTFRNPGEARQFKIEFPHDKHQDVIALNQAPSKTATGLSSAHASFSFTQRGGMAVQEKVQYKNCTICHGIDTREPQLRRGGWPDAFMPKVETFKTVPLSHASCFDCHWKNQEPTSENCAGCHKLTAPYVAADWPTRISLKFSHATPESHINECTTCHINITKPSLLRGLKTDVPLISCANCHNKGERTEIVDELEKLDKNAEFNCAYCHTSEKGLLDAPASHYLIARRTPLSRTDIKK